MKKKINVIIRLKYDSNRNEKVFDYKELYQYENCEYDDEIFTDYEDMMLSLNQLCQ